MDMKEKNYRLDEDEYRERYCKQQMEQNELITKEEFLEMDIEIEKLAKMFEKTECPLEACEKTILALVTRMTENFYSTAEMLTNLLQFWINMQDCYETGKESIEYEKKQYEDEQSEILMRKVEEYGDKMKEKLKGGMKNGKIKIK